MTFCPSDRFYAVPIFGSIRVRGVLVVPADDPLTAAETVRHMLQADELPDAFWETVGQHLPVDARIELIDSLQVCPDDIAPWTPPEDWMVDPHPDEVPEWIPDPLLNPEAFR